MYHYDKQPFVTLSEATVGIAAHASASKHVLNINYAAEEQITSATQCSINACVCGVLDKDLFENREYPRGDV